MQGIEREERRTVLRYVVLCITLTLATISPVVKAKLPTLEAMVTKGESPCYLSTPHSQTTRTHHSQVWGTNAFYLPRFPY